MTSGPNTGPGNTPMILQSIIATQLVHVVGGLNKIDEKMDVIVGLVSESLKNQNTSRGPKSKNDDGKDSGGPGIADIAIGSAIGGVVASVVTSLATKLFSAVTGVFTTLAGSITRYLTPVALVSSAIQSSSSGYSTMGKAFQVLGTAMGMVLLPAFALVGATATTLADRIASDLLPVLGDWIEFILTNGITAIEYFVANVKAAADTIEIMTEAARKFAEWAADSGFLDGITIVAATDTLYNAGKYVYDNMSDQDKQTIGDLGKGGQMGLDPLSSIFQQRLNERLAERGRYNSGESNDFKQGDDGVFRRQKTLREGIFGGLREFAEEMRRSLGGNSQSVGLSDLGRQIQMAALNQTPYEQKMLDWAMKNVDLLQQVVAKLDKPVGH